MLSLAGALEATEQISCINRACFLCVFGHHLLHQGDLESGLGVVVDSGRVRTVLEEFTPKELLADFGQVGDVVEFTETDGQDER